MNPVLRSSAAHVFVDSVESPVVGVDDEHHLFRVMRLRDGETVTVSDGLGRWRATTVASGGLVPSGDVQVGEEPPVCTVATAIPKGDRLDWMVQKLTEVGVHEIVLVQFDRSVVRWDERKAAQQMARLRRIAREAAMQSRRTVVPILIGPVPASDVLTRPDAVLADPSGDHGPLGSCVVIGPEGGFSPDEWELCPRRVCLGGTVLRVETAALVAAVRSLAG